MAYRPSVVSKPEVALRGRIAAVIGAFSSGPVKSAHRDWLRSVIAIEEDVSLLAWNVTQDGGGPSSWDDLQKLAKTLPPAEVEAPRQLADVIAGDLGRR